MKGVQTPSQTVGPYFAYGLTADQYGYHPFQVTTSVLVDASTAGEHVRLTGRVLDAAGEPVKDAMIELWQADATGRYAHPADGRPANADFGGFGRTGTGTAADLSYCFETVKPGSVDGRQAPHLNLIVFMRGLLNHCHTRVYFSDEAAANAADPVLALVPAARRHTLVARREDGPQGPVYHFDIRMQGDDETVFFEIGA
ncbi:MAG: protocatechuate 3,4-dioxygenase subunit alpha [Pseudomonadota bacterium]|nr:protocatechuate 3,4-dioxygenase subunit alpha [Pseudomonadota bacterium]